MNYEQAIRRVDELESLLKQREAHDKMTECGCGDIRPAAEFCHICGKCQMGCCMCAALLEDARKTIDELRVALKWQNLKGGG